jgi:transcriptional regulator with XRE-family HTH domain
MPDELPQEPQSGLGRAVRNLREKAEIDQATLAERAKLPTSLIAELEGGRSDPTWGDMRKVAAALGITLEALSELAEGFEAEDG